MLPALRGLFFLVDMLQTLSGLFSVVDMLPGSPLSGHLPFVAFCLSLPLSLSLVMFLLSRSVQSVPSCRSAYCGPLLIRFQFENPLLWWCRSFSRSVGASPLTSLLVSVAVALVKIHSCGGAGIDRTFVAPMVTLTLSVVVVALDQ
jgi:hypothetical protein